MEVTATHSQVLEAELETKKEVIAKTVMLEVHQLPLVAIET